MGRSNNQELIGKNVRLVRRLLLSTSTMSQFSSLSVSPVRRTVGHLIAVTLLLVLAQFATGNVQSYRVVSRSMQPTLKVGDYVLMLRVQNLVELKDHVVVFSAEDGGTALTKRVLAAGAEAVELHQGQLYINGEQEPYHFEQVMAPGSKRWSLSHNEVFVAGDNRNNSFDSIDHGPIPNERILGIVALRVWPLDRIGIVE